VSGALFEVTESSPQVGRGDQALFFCCGSCVEYFEKHDGDVRAKRGYPS
jgi:hypothetical protein